MLPKEKTEFGEGQESYASTGGKHVKRNMIVTKKMSKPERTNTEKFNVIEIVGLSLTNS